MYRTKAVAAVAVRLTLKEIPALASQLERVKSNWFKVSTITQLTWRHGSPCLG